MRLYLDVCCLNRPFDDPQIDRNRLEAEAVLAIIGWVRKGTYVMISSEAIDRETDACPDLEKAELVRLLANAARQHVVANAKVLRRWQELLTLRFRPLDALHVACAEFAQCDLFLTTDDKLLKLLNLHRRLLHLRAANPLKFVTEIEL